MSSMSSKILRRQSLIRFASQSILSSSSASSLWRSTISRRSWHWAMSSERAFRSVRWVLRLEASKWPLISSISSGLKCFASSVQAAFVKIFHLCRATLCRGFVGLPHLSPGSSSEDTSSVFVLASAAAIADFCNSSFLSCATLLWGWLFHSVYSASVIIPTFHPDGVCPTANFQPG